MASNDNSSSGGIGLLGATFIVFLVLKLTGTIDWSWWWVTAPLWGSLALTVVIGVLVGVVVGVVKGVAAVTEDYRRDRRTKKWAKRMGGRSS